MIHPYNSSDYADEFHRVRPNGESWVNYPENSGAVANSKVTYHDLHKLINDYGEFVDRIGDGQGKYLALMEEGYPASWETRSLHVGNLRDPYNSYRLNTLPEG